MGYQAPPPAEHRLPFDAVVWRLDDSTPIEYPRGPSRDGAHDYETQLTREESYWRPQFSADELSRALAAELAARVVQDAWVEADATHSRDTDFLQGKGARLFVSGEVEEAAWDRSDGEGGRFRLKLRLAATIGRRKAPDLRDFWTKELAADVPHTGWARPELARAVQGLFGPAVEELAQELAKDPAAEALQDDAPPEGGQGP